MLIKRILLIFLSLLLFTSVFAEDEIVLKEQHPTDYVVVRGDTLWDIASRFLRDPWRWPDIWYVNPQIENPHLIYPGDEVVLTFKDGKPRLELKRKASSNGLRVVKLSPRVRTEPLTTAIPTIPVDAIEQFLNRPKVVAKHELDKAPYVASSMEQHLINGTGDKIYVRGIENNETTRFTIFRAGVVYKDTPANKKRVLGYEAIQVGEAVMEKLGDPSSLVITQADREVLTGDRVLPSTSRELDFHFVPHAPKLDMSGNIIHVIDGVSYIGQYQVVVLNLGDEHQLEKGHVLAISQKGEKIRDTVKNAKSRYLHLPEEQAGYLMVFRTFAKVSYALVMSAYREIKIHDRVHNPN
ncbi:MAG: LysM peptidoglycan-binding domain-containing protein [Gammaproteobacteria bacterium]|nr:LysM peptidoglycan-binding domain-containing protein [Gammaproteobacteria bacterium]MDH5727534.1 LysM peptidoglycan-binding domain-containing protein [Gammaproteobacteria bacterium]